MVLTFFGTTLEIALTAAPWLVFGLVVAGILKTYMPDALIARHLSGSGVSAIFRAALIGAPLPLCSCGVLPAALQLRKAGASKAATTSFLVSTPETGVDSIALSWVLLGPFLAIYRPVAAIISAVLAGTLVAVLDRDDPAQEKQADSAVPCDHHCHKSCDAPLQSAPEKETSADSKLLVGLRYAFTDLLDDLAPWLLGGVLAAGAALTILPPSALAEWGGGMTGMLIAILVGIPIYVCASATTPIAQAMLFAGVSPGATLVFMLVGPATNVAGLLLVRTALGTRALIGYLAGVCSAAIGMGLLLDYLVATHLWAWVPTGAAAQPDTVTSWISAPALLVLLLFGIKPLRKHLVPASLS